jgi:hypothetical protein
MGKYLRISSYIRKPFLILYMTLQLLHSEFPYIWGKFSFLFYQCWVRQCMSALASVVDRAPRELSEVRLKLRPKKLEK